MGTLNVKNEMGEVGTTQWNGSMVLNYSVGITQMLPDIT